MRQLSIPGSVNRAVNLLISSNKYEIKPPDVLIDRLRSPSRASATKSLDNPPLPPPPSPPVKVVKTSFQYATSILKILVFLFILTIAVWFGIKLLPNTVTDGILAEEVPDEPDFDTRKKLANILTQVRALEIQGKFAEAIHFLLIVIVDEVQTTLDTTINNSYTAREMLRKSRLTESAKNHVRIVVMGNEKFFFGKKDCSLAELSVCVTAYKSFYKNCYFLDD